MGLCSTLKFLYTENKPSEKGRGNVLMEEILQSTDQLETPYPERCTELMAQNSKSQKPKEKWTKPYTNLYKKKQK